MLRLLHWKLMFQSKWPTKLQHCCNHNVPFHADTPLDCEVSVWSPWGLCKGKCGDSGVQHRTRYVLMHAANNGAACPLLEEERKCFPDNCLWLSQKRRETKERKERRERKERKTKKGRRGRRRRNNSKNVQWFSMYDNFSLLFFFQTNDPHFLKRLTLVFVLDWKAEDKSDSSKEV